MSKLYYPKAEQTITGLNGGSMNMDGRFGVFRLS
jgi:hypothetical protein